MSSGPASAASVLVEGASSEGEAASGVAASAPGTAESTTVASHEPTATQVDGAPSNENPPPSPDGVGDEAFDTQSASGAIAKTPATAANHPA